MLLRAPSGVTQPFPTTGGALAARTFEDSAGTIWEVFEVHRSSHTAATVSNGLERGWLAFVSGDQKRRLAPYPAGWETVAAPELERLCRAARVAPQARYPFDPNARERRRKPREEPTDKPTAAQLTAPLPSPFSPPLQALSEATVEGTVRHFAHDARSRALPAIEAMVQLKRLLAERFPDPDSDARDMRAVRRWFVETYYFEPKR